MFDRVPIWALFFSVLVLVFIAMEVGFALKRRFDRRSGMENDALVSVIVGAVLGLLGFILAFTFSIVYARYEARKELVRQEANAIRRVWMRSEFMDQSGRSFTIDLLKKYLVWRLVAVQAKSNVEVNRAAEESEKIQHALWEDGIAKAKGNSLAGLNAPYLQAINDLIDVHSQRMAIGALDRIPSGIWVSLCTLLLLSMASVGYFAAIKGGKRSPANLILAIAFCLLFVLVSALDDPLHGLFTASQQPLLTVRMEIGG